MSEKKLPQKLKELRKVNNYTQDYVAAVLGIVRQTSGAGMNSVAPRAAGCPLL